MAKKKLPLGLITGVLAVALLIALNPGPSDFKTFYSKRAETSVKKQNSGNLGKALGGLAKAGAGILASSAYERSNLLVASLYQVKVKNEVQSSYLGIAKIFIRLK